MARTRQEWNTFIDVLATSKGLSNSAVAEWKQIRDCFVSIAIILEGLFEMLKAFIATYTDTKQPGTIYWYPGMIKQFQYGHSLVVVNGIPQYETIDTEAQIVTQVSVDEDEDGLLQVKVAKDSAGIKVPLTNDELIALRDYAKVRKAPGVQAIVISRAADVVKYTLTGRYDKLRSKTEVEAELQAAIIAFRDNFGFDAMFYKPQLFEDIMGVTGMKSLQLRIDITFADGTTVSDLVELQKLPAGYFNWDDDSSITLIPAP